MTGLWVATALSPLVVVAGLMTAGLAPDRVGAAVRTWLIRLAPLSVLPALGLALVGPRAGQVHVPWLLVGSRLGIDELARPLLVAAAALYAVALVTVASRGGRRREALTALLLVCFLGNGGVFLARDAVTFYLCFAVMSFAAYGLVVHDRTPEARRAGRVYLLLTVVSETLIIAALMLVVDAGGFDLDEAPAAVAQSPASSVIVLLLLLGFGVKAGAVPLHVWLPLAHPAAPPAASAVLSGSMIKAGIVGWLRFLPLGEVALPGWGAVLVAAGLLGAFLAVVAGVLQSDAKVVLAYSSISQMGFLSVLVGVALLEPEVAAAVPVAAAVYGLHHGLAKGALFLGVPLARHASGASRRLVLAGLLLAGLVLAGAPFTAGSVGKYAGKDAVEGVSFAGADLDGLLPLVATGSTVLLARYLRVLHASPDPRHRPRGLRDAALLAWGVLVAGSAVASWPVATRWVSTAVPGVDAGTLWDASWPVLLGLLLAVLGGWLSGRGLVPRWAHEDGRAVPPGDLLVPAEALARRAAAPARAAVTSATTAATGAQGVVARALRGTPAPAAIIGRAEGQVVRWPVSGLLLVVVLLTIALAGLWWTPW